MQAKKVVQDIIPTSRRSVRSAPLTRESRVKRSERANDEEIIEESEPVTRKTRSNSNIVGADKIKIHKEDVAVIVGNKIPEQKRKKTKRPGFPKALIFLIILICVIIIGIALSLLYSKAIVVVTPEKLNLNVSGNFIAKKDVTNSDTLGYQVVTLSDEASKPITATSGPLIQTKAKGTVTLYNSYSTTTQKIVAGTRLVNNSGLVYKTLTTVTIPGKKMVSGKLVFGSIPATVIADQAGENYNARILDLTGDFKFIGYNGTDKYQGFFGRLKTDITGGYNGKKIIISPELDKAVNDELQATIEKKLLAKVASVVPDGFVMFNKNYTMDYQREASSTNAKDSSLINMKGTMYAVIFNSKALLNLIASKEIQNSRLVNYKVDGINQLNFNLINDKDFSAKKGNTLSFSLNGPVKIAGIINENELKTKLLGLNAKGIDSVIKENPSVKYATVLLTPFWMRSFPNSLDSITIEYK